MGQDEVTADIFSMHFGIIVAELAYTTMQVCPQGTVAGVEMIPFDAFDVTGGIHQAIGRVRGDGHSATEVVHKKAIGAPLARVVPSLEGIAHCLEVTLYVLDKIEDLVGVISMGINTADHESHVNVGNFLVPAVRLKNQEDGGHST